MKKYRGVRPDGESIRIDFRYKSRRYRITWPFKPIAANLAGANQKRLAVVEDITLEKLGLGRFDINKHFPNYQPATDDPAYAPVPTVETAFYDWWKLAMPKLAASTAPRFEGYIREFCSFFGADNPITVVTTDEIERWIADSQHRVLSMQSIQNKLIVLRGVLNYATKRLNALPHNPLADIEPVKPTEQQRIKKKLSRRKIDPFDIDEIKSILRSANGYLNNMVEFSIWTGLRLGEIFALAWEDVDAVHHTIHVQWSYTEHKITPQKNEGSDRVIDLTELPSAWDALQRQRALTFMLSPVTTTVGERRFIFINPSTNGPFTHTEQLRINRWPNLLRRSGVRYRYPYQMRHSFASLMIAAGKDIEWLRKIMGHRDTEMVRRTYARALEQAAKLFGSESRGRLDQLRKAINS